MMIFCGNKECKWHDNSRTYTRCDKSGFKATGNKPRYINACPNEKLKETNKDAK